MTACEGGEDSRDEGVLEVLILCLFVSVILSLYEDGHRRNIENQG